ncbi:hypothetical protein Tco_0926491, partial [Tanacetum coccineum]
IPKVTGSNMIREVSNKYRLGNLSTEYVAAGRACQQALWMKKAIKDYDIHCKDVLVLCDNKDVWVGVEELIRPDEKGAERTLSFGDRISYKSYLTGKHQHTESRTKLEVMKNLVKKLATAMGRKKAKRARAYGGEEKLKGEDNVQASPNYKARSRCKLHQRVSHVLSGIMLSTGDETLIFRVSLIRHVLVDLIIIVAAAHGSIQQKSMVKTCLMVAKLLSIEFVRMFDSLSLFMEVSRKGYLEDATLKLCMDNAA